MNKQAMIEKLAKEIRGNDVFIDISLFVYPATIAVEMFWPLVEATEQAINDFDGMYSDGGLNRALNNLEAKP